jgi:hypothetical protein
MDRRSDRGDFLANRRHDDGFQQQQQQQQQQVND